VLCLSELKKPQKPKKPQNMKLRNLAPQNVRVVSLDAQRLWRVDQDVPVRRLNQSLW